MILCPTQTASQVAARPELHLGNRGPFGLRKVKAPIDALDTHLYCVGMTGKGKSSYLLSLAQQLITQKQGIGLIDPHGDLVSDLLATLACLSSEAGPGSMSQQNRRRIVYLDPRSKSVYPVQPAGRQATHSPMSSHRASSRPSGAPGQPSWPPRRASPTSRIHSLLVLIANRLSLLELPMLLTSKPYREQAAGQRRGRTGAPFLP